VRHRVSATAWGVIEQDARLAAALQRLPEKQGLVFRVLMLRATEMFRSELGHEP
jgi:hypothetical protein